MIFIACHPLPKDMQFSDLSDFVWQPPGMALKIECQQALRWSSSPDAGLVPCLAQRA